MDETLAGAFDLDSAASTADLGRLLAELAGYSGLAPDLWTALAEEIAAQMAHPPSARMEDAEVAHYVVSGLSYRTASDRWRRWETALPLGPDPYHDNLDGVLRTFVAREVAPRLAMAGCFKLV